MGAYYPTNLSTDTLTPHTPYIPEGTDPEKITEIFSHEQVTADATAAALAAITMPDDPFLRFIKRYQNDPVGFVRNVLGADPDDWQVEFLEAVARGERRISIRAGHGVGKSTACAWAMIWFMLTRYPQKTVCTAPTAGQLFDALFSELKFWINKLPDYLRNLLDYTTERVTLKAQPEASFISARTSSADRPEALAGIHSENVLLICDEASAIPEPVFESAAGSMSGHSATTVLIGNPTRNSGLFFQTHHAMKRQDGANPNDADWYTIHVNGELSRRVSKDFISQIRTTYGEESNAYRVRVLGEFALRDDDVLIPAELVDAAMSREVALDDTLPLVYGLDVARFGNDRSVLCKRRGNVVIELKSWQNLDLMQLVGAVVNEASTDKHVDEICVDSIGMGGGVADRLREVQSTVPALRTCRVADVNVSESSAFNPSAMRLRDELWMSCRDWLRARTCKLPVNVDLRQELVSPTYKFQSNGKLQVEPKSDMKKRGLRSPDLADALCLTFASMAAMVGGRSLAWVPGVPIKRSVKGLAGARR